MKEVVKNNIKSIKSDKLFNESSLSWLQNSVKHNYSYNFEWLGRPIIQYPQDILAFQELVWRVKPDLIIETGIAHGGSLILSASILALLDMEEANGFSEKGQSAKKRQVLGIDIEIRPHNKEAIQSHFLANRIHMIEGSSVSMEVAEKVKTFARGFDRVLVCLDSNHTHEHVLRELKIYAPLVSVGSYCIVFDTLIEYLPKESMNGRSWGKGDSPLSASVEYLIGNSQFKIDEEIDSKLQISACPMGYLKRIN